jgi:hypothetical protein
MTTEWVLNTGLSYTESMEFFDLFVDGRYAQSIWIEHDVGSDVWQFVSPRPHYRSPFFKSMEEAKEHLTTFNVINKLEGKAI